MPPAAPYCSHPPPPAPTHTYPPPRPGCVCLQAVDFSRKLSKTNGLPAFQPDDETGDQLVLLSGPPNDMFLDVHNCNSAEVRGGATSKGSRFGDNSYRLNN